MWSPLHKMRPPKVTSLGHCDAAEDCQCLSNPERAQWKLPWKEPDRCRALQCEWSTWRRGRARGKQLYQVGVSVSVIGIGIGTYYITLANNDGLTVDIDLETVKGGSDSWDSHQCPLGCVAGHYLGQERWGNRAQSHRLGPRWCSNGRWIAIGDIGIPWSCLMRLTLLASFHSYQRFSHPGFLTRQVLPCPDYWNNFDIEPYIFPAQYSLALSKNLDFYCPFLQQLSISRLGPKIIHPKTSLILIISSPSCSWPIG